VSRARWLVPALPLAWLGVFFLLPFLVVVAMSLAPPSPPGHSPLPAPGALLREWATNGLDWRNYAALFRDSLYVDAYLNSLLFAGVSTLACLALGYPIAYGIARARPASRAFLLMLVVLPFWTSSLLRNYALIGILKGNGLLNQVLIGLGLVASPVEILHTDLAVYIGIVYGYLPFMVLPLAASLMRLDFTLLEAAADLGAQPFEAFWRVTWPLSRPGVIAGSLLVFVPAVGEFVVPDLLGGPRALTIGRVIWTEFFSNRDWARAAAVAVGALLVVAVPLLWFERRGART
jgi:putrescine transport system permease protein